MPYTFSECLDESCSTTVDDVPDLDLLSDGPGGVPRQPPLVRLFGLGAPTARLSAGTQVLAISSPSSLVGQYLILDGAVGFRQTVGPFQVAPTAPVVLGTSMVGILTEPVRAHPLTSGLGVASFSGYRPLGQMVKLPVGTTLYPRALRAV